MRRVAQVQLQPPNQQALSSSVSVDFLPPERNSGKSRLNPLHSCALKSFFIYLFIAFTIAGCSQHTGNDKSGRVAAVVNGVEITQREVDFLYQRTAAPGADSLSAFNQRRSILAGLVRAELLAQQATKMKVDQSPEFVIALHDARRRVLAGLAEEKIASTAKPVSPENVQQIISDNPTFFADRKLLVYEEILVSGVDVPFLQSLNVSASKGASLSQLLDAVKAKAIPFQRATRTLTTDQIDPGLLKVLNTLKPNVPVVARVENKFSMILMLHTALPIPLEGKTAELAAANLANTQQRNVAFSQKMRAVLDGSKITYFGEFKPDAVAPKWKKQVVALPVPDAVRAQEQLMQQAKLAASLVISCTAAMLLFFTAKCILVGKLWLPRLWPAPKLNITSGKSYDYNVYPASRKNKLIVYFIRASSFLPLFYHLSLLWDSIPFWMIPLSLIIGILVGTGVSYLFSLQLLKKWAKKLRWFRWIQIVMFDLLLLTGVFLAQRLISQ
ncbi:MAG: peptidyl-prolyl cis-trans isomerase, EpsD family [Chlorobium sp.]|nr:MAG: peptidyl-prolyl cis-trans isomerase, EpsD family [Chlorobium sp.]